MGKRRTFIWYLAGLLLVCTMTLPAAAQSGACEDARSCAGQRQTERLKHYGLEPIAVLAQRRTRVVRVFFVDTGGQDRLALSFFRPVGREPQLEVKLAGPPLSQLNESVPDRVWQEVLSGGTYFDRDLTPLPPRNDGSILVCADGWTTIVETSDADGNVRTKEGHDCKDETRLVGEYGRTLLDVAVRSLVQCSDLNLGHTPWPDDFLKLCAALRGDRAAAALATNVFFVQRLWLPYDETGIDRAMRPDVRLKWFDGSDIKDRQKVAQFLSENVRFIWPDAIVGETPEKVTMTGTLEADADVEAHLDDDFVHPVSIKWLNEFGDFQVEEISVGPRVRR